MKVKCRVASPVKQRDGSWKVITEEFEKDVPDKGRATVHCNDCELGNYPKCMKLCPIGKKYVDEHGPVDE